MLLRRQAPGGVLRRLLDHHDVSVRVVVRITVHHRKRCACFILVKKIAFSSNFLFSLLCARAGS